MKKAIILLIFIFACNLYAGIYKVYFINGGIVVLKEKPDFSKEKVIGVTPDGKKILFLRKLVDFKKTEQANKPKKPKEKAKEKIKEKVKDKKSINVIPSKVKSKKKPLIITEATVGKKEKKDKKKKPSNPFMEWKNEGVREGSDLDEPEDMAPEKRMSEKEARMYWRNRFIQVNNAIENVEDTLKDIDEELGRLLTEKLNTDDNIVIMRINGEIQNLEKKKKKLEEKLKKLKKQKEDLKNEARKAGALPGWYRDLI